MHQRLLFCFTFCLLLTGLAPSVRAQILYPFSGTVRDSATGQPLERAAVVIDYEKATSGTYTDAQGRYHRTPIIPK